MNTVIFPKALVGLHNMKHVFVSLQKIIWQVNERARGMNK